MAAWALAYVGAGLLVRESRVMAGPVSLFWLPAVVGLTALLRGGLAFALPLWPAAILTSRMFGSGWLAATGAGTASIIGLSLSVLLAALLGVLAMRLSGRIGDGPLLPFGYLLNWWSGDWMAVMVFGPLLLTLDRINLREAGVAAWRHRYWVAAFLLVMVAMVPAVASGRIYQLPWVLVPVLVLNAATMLFGRPAVIIGVPVFAVYLIGVALLRQVEGAGGSLSGNLRQDWVLLAGVGAIAWLVATLQHARDREANERAKAERRLLERKRMLRAVLDHAPLGIWMQDRTGRLQYVNRAFCEAVGIPEERFLAVPHYRELFPPEVARSCMASDEAALAQDLPHTSREQLPFVDGGMHQLEIIKSRLRDENGEVVGLIGISMDVTERRRAEESLRVQGQALDSAANAILITDAEGRIEWANRAFSALTGYTLEESVGRRPGELLGSGKHDARFFREMWQVISSGRTWFGRMVNRRKDGSLYTERMTITPLLDAGGKVQRYIAIKEDVTALVQAEEALRQSEERYRQLFEGHPMPMFIFEEGSLRIVDANATALQLYGYAREEFLALTLRDIRPPEDQGYLDEKLKATESMTQGYVGEVRHQRQGGETFIADIHLHRLRVAGRAVRLVMVQDITEKKRLQDQVMRTQRMESIGLLAAGIAHDLNNILTPMRMVGPMLRAQVRSPEDQRILSLVDHSAERGAALVRQILAFAHGTGTERGPVQLKEVVRDVALFVSETFPKELQFRHLVPASLWPVSANPTQIHQVLLNLCVNARDAMGPGGTLSLRASNERLTLEDAALIPGGREGAFICLEVADTGSGIHPSVLPHIWEPFFTTKTTDKGTGLGLSTVRGIINSHEGFCSVESTLGEGTTFRIYLPALEEPVSGKEDTEGIVRHGRDELVLVVDDESIVRDAVRDALLIHGYRILTAVDGIEALQLLEMHRREIRLMVTDIRMPRMGGERLIAVVRESYPELKVFAMSGDTDMTPEPGNRSGPHAFIAKPFDLGEFRRTVNQLLSENPAKN